MSKCKICAKPAPNNSLCTKCAQGFNTSWPLTKTLEDKVKRYKISMPKDEF